MAALKAVPQTQPEDLGLTMAAKWLRARAEILLHWARDNERTLSQGAIDGPARPDRAIADLEDAADWLVRLKPRTVAGARQMLTVATTILEHRAQDEDGCFNDGPALEIVTNVRKALDYLDGDQQIEL